MSLIEIPLDFADDNLPEKISDWIELSNNRIRRFWDSFAKRPLSQYVECDFAYVAAALNSLEGRDIVQGKLFLEWGCGFGVICGIASLLGYDAVGIEAEPWLCEQARKLLRKASIPAEIWTGNFLPAGARRLAVDDDPVVSLSHSIAPAYDNQDLQLDDFAIVFAYPWPGEEHFLKSVFDRYAGPAACLLLFLGPYEIELYQKLSH